ncbi:MAG: extracellular solute-binding protein [Anaerolineae bacterium]|nr:extracellular solute-binding protein [Anaerolineae bacterium]
MSKKLLLTLVALLALSALALAPVSAQDPVVVQWFVGLGTGTNEQQIAAQQQVVADFNAAHDDIELELILAASNQVAPDTLSTLIAGGTPPDIVGPVGVSGSNLFSRQWLDLQPLIDAAGYDLSVYPDALVDLYRTDDGLVGIPFAVYPSLMFYNIDLFDEAELNYPPSEFGAPYVMPDGSEVEWNWDTVAEIAKFLTVDANGNDATMDGFDTAAVEQFGFIQQWSTQRADFSTFGGYAFYDAESGTVTIPENWRAEAEWMWKGLWESHFIPNNTYVNSQLFSPTPMASGRVAMARVPLWYTCCIGDQVNFDFAPVPAYEGGYYAPTDVDTFYVHETTDTPAEAFAVVSYLQGEAAASLLSVYGAFPALPELQEPYLAERAVTFPSVTNWGLINESLAYAAAPHHESDNPNYARTQQRFADFATLLLGDTGADIDLEAELDALQADLQAIIDEAM